MRAATSFIPQVIAFCLLAGLLWLGGALEARAAGLCPSTVAQPVVIPGTPARPGNPGTCTVTTHEACVPSIEGAFCANSEQSCTTFSDCPVTSTAQAACTAAGSCPTPANSVGSACIGVVPPTAATPTTTTTKTATGFVLQNGLCTNDLSGFSGAALASQALSGLAQTATQATTAGTENTIVERREVERQRCPEGFRRVDGTCEAIPAPAAEIVPATRQAEAAPIVPLPPIPMGKPVPEKARQAKIGAVAERKAPPSTALPRKLAPAGEVAPYVARRPAPIEAPVRFGTWVQLYGDYERRNATGPASIFSLVTNSQIPLGLDVQSKTSTIGFQVGADMTTRSLLFPGDGLIVGALGGYVTSKVRMNSASLSSNLAAVLSGFSTLNANLSGPEGGLYATYFNGGFSTDFLAKFDVFQLDENFTDTIAFAPGPADAGTPPFLFASNGSGSVGLLSTTLAGNINYRFDLYPNLWLEPTVGAQYTNLTYGSGAAQLGLEDGSLVMIQGGLRLGTDLGISERFRTTAILTGLAYDDVLIAGGFIPGAAFAANNILVQADRGQVRGRGIVALKFDFGQGFTSFVQGEARGGSGLFGAGGRAGIRYQW